MMGTTEKAAGALPMATSPGDTGRAMSQENVELVRGSFEAYLRGDLETALAGFDPEVEIYDHDIPDAGEYRGLEGVLRWQDDWDREWESWRWDPEEYIDAGERVVAVLRVYAKGRQSGVEVERLDGAVYTMRDGKCVRLDYYGSKEQALEAVGLRE
jgi:ketosteroid isomerase-like protein